MCSRKWFEVMAMAIAIVAAVHGGADARDPSAAPAGVAITNGACERVPAADREAMATPVAVRHPTAAAPVTDAADATGFGGRWSRRIKTIAELAGCALDGAALAHVFIVGITGVGGVVAAAALGVAALACLG